LIEHIDALCGDFVWETVSIAVGCYSLSTIKRIERCKEGDVSTQDCFNLLIEHTMHLYVGCIYINEM